MLSLIDPTTVPPGGFRYLQKETNAILSAASLPELLTKVRNHRIANNLPISLEWKMEIEQWLCEQLPSGLCRHLAGTRDIPMSPESRPLTVNESIIGAKILGSWLLKGFSKISQQEADARAKTCAACPFNQPADGCTTCASESIRQAVESVIGNSRTASHDSLHTCRICGCNVKVAVWVPKELMDKHKPQEQISKAPEWCWVR
jgi:hypothetical protein